jgi:hypothetical protein
MMIKAVPIRRVNGPVSRTGAIQAFFCHACDTDVPVSECTWFVSIRAMAYLMTV